MWYIYTMEYNSAAKMNEIMLFAVTWMDLRDCHTVWSQTEKQMLYVIPYMRNLKRNDMNELIYKTEIDSQT